MPQVILVDSTDKVIGVADKLQAHRDGALHRAVSVILFNSRGEILLQQRALSKYHSGSLWANTCCTHPAPDQTTEQAALDRLSFEMGISCNIEYEFQFTYFVNLDHGLIEHELDHVFYGQFDGAPVINQDEVMNWRWTPIPDLQKEIAAEPEKFAYWFRLLLPKIAESDSGKRYGKPGD